MILSSPVFKNAKFKRLFIGRTISLFGTSISYIAIMQRFYDLAGSASHWAYLAAVKAIPFLIFGLAIGYLADKFNKKMILITSDFARVILYLALAFCQDLHLFFVLTFLASIFEAAYEPTYKSLATGILSKEELFAANSLEESTKSIFAVLGIGVAGLMVGTLGTTFCLQLDALSYALSGLTVCLVPYRKSEDIATFNQKSFREEFLLGLKTLQKTPAIYYPLFVWTLIVLIISFESPMFFPLMIEKNWGGADVAGYFYAMVSLGSFATSIFLLRKLHSPMQGTRSLALLLFLDATALAGILLVKALWLGLLFAVALGVIEILFRTYSITFIQRSIPVEASGRVFSAIYMIHEPLRVFAMLGSGLIVSQYSAVTGFGVAIGLEYILVLISLIATSQLIGRLEKAPLKQ